MLRAGMKDLHAVDAVGFVDTGDQLARLEARRDIRPTPSRRTPPDRATSWKSPSLTRPATERFNRFQQIALQAHHDGLRLGIAKAAVELQHHRTRAPSS